MTRSRHKIARRRFWTREEEQILRERYPDTPTEDLATLFGRNVRTVYAKASGLGLKKSPAYLASPAAGRLRKRDTRGLPTRFKPGMTPWNKGTNYDAGGRSPETRFKPGTLNGRAKRLYRKIGSERICADGYLERKVTHRGVGSQRWKGVHLILWEEHHGPVPEGFAVCFVNGDKRDIRIENLELVSRQDLMRRNTIHRFPAELVSAIQLHNGLKRRIAKRSRA